MSAGDPPPLDVLLGGCAAEAAALAREAAGGTRQRLLVLAHALGVAAREAAAGPAAPAATEDPAALAAAIRGGAHDGELDRLAARLREDVRVRLEIAHPGYAAG